MESVPRIETGTNEAGLLGVIELEDQAIEAAEELACAYIEERRKLVDNWISDEWQYRFKLAQHLQGLSGALDAFSLDPEIFRPAVDVFFSRVVKDAAVALARESGDRDWDYPDWDDYMDARFCEFIDVWHKVREPGGEGALVAAYREAESARITTLSPIPRLGWRFDQLVSTAYHLQRFRGEAPILLPIVKLGELLACHHSHVSSLTSNAQRYGLL